jgi:propionyl-CoA carboxylase alpha chain
VLRHPEFLAGEADTSFLERHPIAELSAPLLDHEAEAMAAVAAALAGQAHRRREARSLRDLPSGWRNNPSDLQRVTYTAAGDREISVGYRLGRDGALCALEVDGERREDVEIARCAPGVVELSVDGIRRRYAVRSGHINTVDGQADLVEHPRFPDASERVPAGSLTSPMPGLVIRVLAQAGAQVDAGQPLLVMEAMKMEHEIVAPAAGTLAHLHIEEGAQVEAGAVLAVIEEAG